MPILSYFCEVPLNESTIFLGTCDFAKKAEFEIKIKAWCVAYGHSWEQVRCQHHYLGCVSDNLQEW